MILSGELKDFSLADVLQLLLQQRKSGMLVLSDKKEKAELFVSQGDLTGVRVNGDTPEGKVKDMLVETGRVPKAEIGDLEAISRDMNRPLLSTLIAKGHLSEEDRGEWLQIITEDMVCELFGWVDGNYEFVSGQKPSGAVAEGLNISTEFACMEGMRRIDEWPRLRAALPDFKSVFRPTGRVFPAERDDWDRLVLGLVDGRRNVTQIGRQVPFGSFRLSECIVNLWNGGFIAPVQVAGGTPEAPVQPDPQSEKDRKTAMVLGLGVLFLIFAISVRLFSVWTGNSSGTAGTEAALDFGAATARELAKENMQAFLIDHAARNDSLPKNPYALVRDGAMTAREISGSGTGKIQYLKASEKAFTLK